MHQLMVISLNALQLCRQQFSHKYLVADFLQAKYDFTPKTAVLSFSAPVWGVRGNVQWSSLAHWKECIGLPISVNWTFFAKC